MGLRDRRSVISWTSILESRQCFIGISRAITQHTIFSANSYIKQLNCKTTGRPRSTVLELGGTFKSSHRRGHDHLSLQVIVPITDGFLVLVCCSHSSSLVSSRHFRDRSSISL